MREVTFMAYVPYPPPRGGYWYIPIEGTVYDMIVSGDEVLLYTSNGEIKYRVKGITIKYMRIPSEKSIYLTYIGMFTVIILIFLVFFFMFSSGFPSFGFFQLFTTMAMVFFFLVLGIIAVYTASMLRPKPVLVVVDHTGVEHYYRIASENREKILRLASSYR